MKRWNVLGIVLLVVLAASCANPTGPGNTGGSDPLSDGDGSAPTTGGDSGDGSGADIGTGGSSGDPVTITFVLDMDTGSGVTLSTSATAPAPITVTAGEPVRLTQGMGFTATGPIPGGGTGSYHASGWSTEPYSSQFQSALIGPNVRLPGYETTFSQDTTLYIRWLPALGSLATQVTYHEPGVESNTTVGPILHVGDQKPFETTAQFVERVSPSWTVPANEGIYSWQSVERSAYQPNVTNDEVFVWKFFTATESTNVFAGTSGLQNITVSYTTRPVWTVTFDYNGATGGIGDETRIAYNDVEARLNPGWDYIAPTRNGLRFGGWWTARDSGEIQWSDGSSTITSTSPVHDDWFTAAQSNLQRKVTNNMTLYARWIADVTFNENGGSTNGGGPTAQSVYVNAGAAPSVTPPALHAAYDHDVFVGWYSDSALTTLVSSDSSNVAVTQSGTLYAGWGPDPQYAVEQTGLGGGVIFYVKDGDGPRATSAQAWRFLEVAPDDIDGEPDYTGRATWGLHVDSAKRTVSTAPADDSLGGGFDSTASLLTERPGGETNNAAYQASEYNNGGKTDWYLPSVAELLQLANLWNDAGLTSGFGPANLYWASSSYEGRGFLASTDGNPTAMGVRRSSASGPLSVELQQRNNHSKVRPIRRF